MQCLRLSARLLQNNPRRECQDNQDPGEDLIFTTGFVFFAFKFRFLYGEKLRGGV